MVLERVTVIVAVLAVFLSHVFGAALGTRVAVVSPAGPA